MNIKSQIVFKRKNIIIAKYEKKSYNSTLF